MTLLESLILFTPIVTIAANVTVVFYVVPAFKRTKNKAFLWLGCAALLGTFDTVCDQTIGIDSYRRSRADYVTYRTLRKFTYIADCAFSTTGIVLLALGAVKGNQPDSPSDNARNV